MQGRMYTATFRSATVNALQDLFLLVAAAAVPVWVHEILITCRNGTDERLNIMIHRATTTGSLGTTPTPRPLNPGVTTTASTTVRANDTTQGGDGDIVDSFEWDLRSPAHRLPVPSARILIPGGGRLAVSLETAPAAARTMSGSIVFEEVG